MKPCSYSLFMIIASFSYDMTYCICLIRLWGYYLFHHTILCGYNLRLATNWEWRLLNSAIGKIFCRGKNFEKCYFCKSIKELWCGDLVANLPASWSGATLLHSGTYTAPLIQFVLVALHVLIYIAILFVHMRTCYSNISHGYYLRAVTISFSTSRGVATIQQWQLIDNVWSSKYCMQLHVYISI